MPTLCSNCANFSGRKSCEMEESCIQRPRARLLVCVPSLGDLNSKRRASCRSSARDEVLQMFTVCTGWIMSWTSRCTTALRRHSQRTMMNSAQLHSEFSVDLRTPELRCDTNPSSTPGAPPPTPLDSGSLPDRVPVSRRCSAFRDALRMCSAGTAEAHLCDMLPGTQPSTVKL